MNEAPPPFTPPDCDLRDFRRMMIDITRLQKSDFDAITNDTAWRAGINLWLSAWHGDPAGSLGDREETLVKAAGLGRDIRTWRKVKDDALRGFVLCSDGLLYHPTVCEFALEAWIEKLKQQLASGAGNAKRWGGAFDAAAIEARIDVAIDMLTHLNPLSPAIGKAERRRSRRNSDGNPDGSGMPSRRTEKPVPSGSLGTGKGKEEREEGSVADATGGEPPEKPPPDPEKVMFDSGLKLLADAGVAAAKARPLLGKWKRDYGAEAVIVALGKAQREGAIDPISFIEGCLKNANGVGNGRGRGSGWGAARDRNRVQPVGDREPLLEQHPRPG